MTHIISGREWSWKTSVFAALLLGIASGIAHGQQNKLPTIDDIQRAWQARQDRVRTARIIWKEQRTWPKGAISLFYPSSIIATKIPEIKGKIMPQVDTTVDFSYVVTMENDKVRYEYEGKEWSNGRQDFRPTKYLSAFNGKSAKDVYPIGLSDVDWPQGAIRSSNNYRDAALSSLLPLILVYRPFVPSLKPSDDFRGMRLIGQQLLDGRPCVELVQRLSTSSTHIWVDTERDFTLTRRLVIDQGKPMEQIDICYRHDENMSWVPTSWKIVNHHYNGKLFYSFDAEVSSSEFNMSVAQNTFEFDFPSGTWVLNENNRESYIVRADGAKRPVSGEEMRQSYEQLVNSEPDKSPFPVLFLKSLWPLAAAVAIGLLTLGVFLWRRSRLREPLQNRGD